MPTLESGCFFVYFRIDGEQKLSLIYLFVGIKLSCNVVFRLSSEAAAIYWGGQ